MPDLYFITKSGETQTLKDDKYVCHDNIFILSNRIYIPFSQILYFKVTQPFFELSNCLSCHKFLVISFDNIGGKVLPPMNQNIKTKVSGPHIFSFSKVSCPHYDIHCINFLEATYKEEKMENIIIHYFPLDNLISLETKPVES
jgi:hypothetical protein